MEKFSQLADDNGHTILPGLIALRTYIKHKMLTQIGLSQQGNGYSFILMCFIAHYKIQGNIHSCSKQITISISQLFSHN